MPAAVIAISMLIALVVGTPSTASQPCMSKAEARQHFGSIHIYWHGRDRCWNATPSRRHNEIRKVQQAKWRDAMSDIVPESKPEQTTEQPSWLERWVDIGPSQLLVVAASVDGAGFQSPSIVARETRSMITPRFLLLACIAVAIALTLATIEFLFRRTIYD
jgi:preprotein translocase subunit Sec61beta